MFCSVKSNKRGRTKEWFHEHFIIDKSDDTFRFCNVMMSKKLADGTVSFHACGKRLKYVTGVKKTPSPKSMKAHLVDEHQFTKDGTVRQQTLTLDAKGGVRVKGPVAKWSVVDPRTQRIVADIARWFAIDGTA